MKRTEREREQTVVGHSEDGYLSDGAIATLHTTGSLVDGGQIGVHVAREATPTGHLLSSCRHLLHNNDVIITTLTTDFCKLYKR